MTKVTVFAKSGNVHTSGGNVYDSGGIVCNSGEIEYGLGNLGGQIVIHNFAYISSEDTWNSMWKFHYDVKKKTFQE